MIKETYNSLVEGIVSASFTRDGTRIPVVTLHNAVMNSTADSLAQLYSGQPRIEPKNIGFIYGSGSKWTQNLDPTLTMDDLLLELHDHSADVQVLPFSFSPSLSSSDPAKFKTNIVTFHGHTDSDAEGLIQDIGGIDQATYVFGAVLLDANGPDYNILNRVVLEDINGDPLVRPNGFELSLDWSIVFNNSQEAEDQSDQDNDQDEDLPA